MKPFATRTMNLELVFPDWIANWTKNVPNVCSNLAILNSGNRTTNSSLGEMKILQQAYFLFNIYILKIPSKISRGTTPKLQPVYATISDNGLHKWLHPVTWAETITRVRSWSPVWDQYQSTAITWVITNKAIGTVRHGEQNHCNHIISPQETKSKFNYFFRF